MPDQFMTVSEVARQLGVCAQTVRDLDERLQPQRTTGNIRLYDPRIVERVRKEREAKKEKKARARAS